VIPRLTWYVNRLRCMSARELAGRVATAARLHWQARFDARPRPAPAPRQAFGRAWFDGYVGDDTALRRAADDVLEGRMRVLGLGEVLLGSPPQWRRDAKTGVFAPLRFGPLMNLGDQRVVGDIKSLWEPSRHHALVPLAQAWRASRDPRYLDGLNMLLSSWIEQNPHPLGPHWSSSLECGIRLINWSLVWQLVDAGDKQSELSLRHPGLVARWLDAIYWHLGFVRRNLSAHSSANNHLIGELTGLFVGLCTWRCWPSMDGWRDDTQARLAHEALRQNTPDGVNREQASSYQQFVLEFMLIAAMCARANGCDFARDYWARAQAMCGFMAALTDAGGHWPKIGDADDGVACGVFAGGADNWHSVVALGALLFDRADLACAVAEVGAKTLFWLGADGVERFALLRARGLPAPLPQWFRDGGYAVLGCDAGSGQELRLVFDAGPLGYLGIAAHGHDDALSVLVSVAGEPLLIDPGTYSYHGPIAWREHFRSTRAHNTLEIDGCGPSRSGGRFMWLRHANARLIDMQHSEAVQIAVGEHDGYARPGHPLTHRRRVRLDAQRREIEVTDELLGDGVHDVVLRWHAAAQASVADDGNVYVLRGHRGEIRIGLPVGMQRALVAARDESPQAWVSPSYERKVPSHVIECTRRAMQLPCALVTRIQCGARASLAPVGVGCGPSLAASDSNR
jgi:hypothetical protein